MRPTRRRWWFPAVAMLALGGCESATRPADAPEGHTVFRDGVAHAPGLSEPLANCTECHGPTLEGGSAGEPSCTVCHGVVW